MVHPALYTWTSIDCIAVHHAGKQGHWGWHVTFSTPYNRCALPLCAHPHAAMQLFVGCIVGVLSLSFPKNRLKCQLLHALQLLCTLSFSAYIAIELVGVLWFSLPNNVNCITVSTPYNRCALLHSATIFSVYIFHYIWCSTILFIEISHLLHALRSLCTLTIWVNISCILVLMQQCSLSRGE